MPLLAELKRRNVFRVAALYAAVAWLLIQVTDVVSEPLGLPVWLLKVVIWLLAIGFPVALVLAWSFELTPAGLQRDRGEEHPPRIGVSAGRKLDFAIIAALVAALGYFVATRSPDTAAPAVKRGAAAPPTLAVLPFQSMSSSVEDGYFADGLTEELLNLLAGIEGLKVAGRTSSFYFKGRNEDLRDIGRKLGVSHILEGSVRRSGPKLRITAQLVSADDGFHVWSRAYDRELTDVLAIQDEIGQSVADALEVRLVTGSGDGRPVRRADAEAYRLYLVARSRMRERGLENTESAIRLFDQAVEIDPAYADAYAGKALAIMLAWFNHGVGDSRTMLAEAEHAGRSALELDPDSSEAHVALGLAAELSRLVTGHDRKEEAGRHFQRALELDPKSTLALYWLGRFEQEADPESAIELFDRAIELDPLEVMAAGARALTLLRVGRTDEARSEYERLLEIYPDNSALLRNYADVELITGRPSRALIINARASEAGADDWSHWLNARAWWLLGDADAARAELMKLDQNNRIKVWQRETSLAMLQRDLPRVLELDRALARDGGPAFARYAEFSSLVWNGRDAEALRLAEEIAPNMTAASPTVTGDRQVCGASDLALVLSRLGKPEPAKRLVDVALTTWDRTPGLHRPQDYMCRVRLLAVAGRRDEALIEFKRAVDRGFRDFMDWGFVSIEYDPSLDGLREDPRFQAQMKRIDEDLARQRVEADAWRKG